MSAISVSVTVDNVTVRFEGIDNDTSIEDRPRWLDNVADLIELAILKSDEKKLKHPTGVTLRGGDLLIMCDVVEKRRRKLLLDSIEKGIEEANEHAEGRRELTTAGELLRGL